MTITSVTIRISPIIKGLEAFGKISNVIVAKCVTDAAKGQDTGSLQKGRLR